MFPTILRAFPFKADRQYTIDHWRQGKDFIITHTGQHCSIRDQEVLERDFPTIAVQYGQGLYLTIWELNHD